MTSARKNLIDAANTPYYHCMARCVRRPFLCDKDDFSGKNYEHRRQWVVDRVKVFAVEVSPEAVLKEQALQAVEKADGNHFCQSYHGGNDCTAFREERLEAWFHVKFRR